MCCSNCGGFTAGEGGAPVSACVYCSSSVLVPSETVRALLDDTRSIARATSVRDEGAVRAAYAAGAPLVWPIVFAVVAAVLGLPLVILAGYRLRAVAPVPTTALLPIPIAAMVWALVISIRSIAAATRARLALEGEIAAIADRVHP